MTVHPNLALFTKDRGQSLGEYGLILGLVSITSIALLVGLGENIRTAIDDITAGSRLSMGTTALINTGTGTSTGGGAAGQNPPGGNGGSGSTTGGGLGGGGGTTTGGGLTPPSIAGGLPTQRTCINATLCIDLPTPAQDGQSVSDVSGNLGGNIISQYGNAMDQLIDQLIATEGLSGAEVADLVALAKQGHLVGDNLSNIDKQCQARTNKSQMCDVSNIQSMGTGGMPPNPLMDRTHFQQMLVNIKSQFKDPNGLGGKVSPATQNLVVALSNHIVDISRGAAPITELSNPTTGPVAPTQTNPDVDPVSSSFFSIMDTNGAKLIHIDANTICGTGTQQTAQCSVKTN